MAEKEPSPEPSTSRKKSPDAKKHAIYLEGDDLHTSTGLFIVEKPLQNGIFGTVFRCLKKSTNEVVALKVIKKCYTDVGNEEVAILKKLNRADAGKHHCIQMLDSFYFEGHMCISFELLGPNLRQYLEVNHHFALKDVWQITRDLLQALCKLKELDLIHGDLKPANIVLVNPGDVESQTAPYRVKLIDFGATHKPEDQPDKPYVQTSWYRSPEIILQLLPYSRQIDMWSLGCTIGELLSGQTLFPGRCEYDTMRYIVEVLGFPNEGIIRRAKMRKYYFRESSRVSHTKGKWRFVSPDKYALSHHYRSCKGVGLGQITSFNRKIRHRGLEGVAKSNQDTSLSLEETRVDVERREHFQTFLSELLEMDPEKRLTPTEALSRDFMTIDFESCN